MALTTEERTLLAQAAAFADGVQRDALKLGRYLSGGAFVVQFAELVKGALKVLASDILGDEAALDDGARMLKQNVRGMRSTLSVIGGLLAAAAQAPALLDAVEAWAVARVPDPPPVGEDAP